MGRLQSFAEENNLDINDFDSLKFKVAGIIMDKRAQEMEAFDKSYGQDKSIEEMQEYVRSQAADNLRISKEYNELHSQVIETNTPDELESIMVRHNL